MGDRGPVTALASLSTAGRGRIQGGGGSRAGADPGRGRTRDGDGSWGLGASRRPDRRPRGHSRGTVPSRVPASRGHTLQLSPAAPTGPAPTDVAGALARALAAWGQRPAITVHSRRGREEQGFASLAQWAAKGAHLLELELHLGPGDAIGLDAPVSWPAAAVCLAAWWSGITVLLGPSDAEVVVVHTARDRPSRAGEVLWLGDAVDGAPTEQAAASGEAWVRAVQSFPDQPPAPRAAAGALALLTDGRSLDQAGALALAGRHGPGTLGLELAVSDPLDALLAVALRPLLTGRPTVVLDGVGREVAAGEKVAGWA